MKCFFKIIFSVVHDHIFNAYRNKINSDVNYVECISVVEMFQRNTSFAFVINKSIALELMKIVLRDMDILEQSLGI